MSVVFYVLAAVTAGLAEYERVYGRKADSDDAFVVIANDEEIIIRFELKEAAQP
jgi:hypothetical protein